MPATSNKINKALNGFKAFASPVAHSKQALRYEHEPEANMLGMPEELYKGKALMGGIRRDFEEIFILHGSEA